MEDLADMKERLVVLEVKQGRIALSPGMLALIWAIALAMIGSAGASGVSAYQSKQALERIDALALKLDAHVEAPWHSAAAERYRGQDLRMEQIEKRIDNLERKR